MEPTTKTKIVKYIGYFFDFIAIVLLIMYFEGGFSSIIAILIYFLVFSIWRLWKMREMVMDLQRSIELILVGKTLDKGNWKKGELWERIKNTQVVWKKKGDENNNTKKFDREDREKCKGDALV